MKRASLFREEALSASRIQWLGEIVLIRPLSFGYLTAIAAVLGLLVIALFVFCSYTKRSSVRMDSYYKGKDDEYLEAVRGGNMDA
jgi:membrane fusion protein